MMPINTHRVSPDGTGCDISIEAMWDIINILRLMLGDDEKPGLYDELAIIDWDENDLNELHAALIAVDEEFFPDKYSEVE